VSNSRIVAKKDIISSIFIRHL